MYEKPIRIEMTDEEWIASRNPRSLISLQQFKAPEIIERIDEPKPIKAAKKKPAKIHRKTK